jgi:glycosyltransferase involved in cell wall biosynthesis
MRFLFLTQIVPYPPDSGPRVKTWNVLRYLSEMGHQIILASFVRPEEQANLKMLEGVCSQVHAVRMQRSRFADVYYLLRSQISGRPFIIERDDLREMRSLVSRLVKTEAIDCVYADQLTMTQFATDLRRLDSLDDGPDREELSASKDRPLIIYDAHNAVWTTVERMAENAHWLMRPLIELEARRVKRYQAGVVRNFDHTFAVTEVDRGQLLAAAAELDGVADANTSGKLSVFPITVDTGNLQPIERRPSGVNIMTLGTLHYPPNADGIRWFAMEVFPLVRQTVPEAKLTIVGKNPPQDFIQLAQDDPEHIVVTGYVPDLLPYYADSVLVVVPVRAGSGMRVRILETFALGMPTVTTTVGLEGIDAVAGEEVLVADSAPDFAASVVEVLMDEDKQNQLARRGRSLAESRYDWQVGLSRLENVITTVRKE